MTLWDSTLVKPLKTGFLNRKKMKRNKWPVVDLPESYKDAQADVTGTFRAGFQLLIALGSFRGGFPTQKRSLESYEDSCPLLMR
jgi:hypothetical protein